MGTSAQCLCAPEHAVKALMSGNPCIYEEQFLTGAGVIVNCSHRHFMPGTITTKLATAENHGRLTTWLFFVSFQS
jgi:hypothetical protein